MDKVLKYLIIITLAYYLIKGLLYLLLWQMTYKVQEKAMAAKKKEIEKKQVGKEIWVSRFDEDTDQ